MSKLADLWTEVSRLRLCAALSPVKPGDGRLWRMKLGLVETGPGPAETVVEEALRKVRKFGIEKCRLPLKPPVPAPVPRIAAPPPPKPPVPAPKQLIKTERKVPELWADVAPPKPVVKKPPAKGGRKGKFSAWQLPF